MVNLVWSFASILGAQCACNAHIFGMFKNVRKEAIVRCGYFTDEQGWTERNRTEPKRAKMSFPCHPSHAVPGIKECLPQK
eukprot:1155728-Pelagomonas_calceolata.AAC.10